MQKHSSGIAMTRRQLMLAAVAAALTPASLFAAQCGGGLVAAAGNPAGAAATNGFAAGDTLVVSGRVLGFGCQPLAGAVIEVWHDAAAPVRTITDGDGRFVLTTLAPPAARGEAPHLSYQVTHPAHDLRARELYFTRQGNHAADSAVAHAADSVVAHTADSVAQVERDAAGVWRAAFGLSLA